VLSSVPEQADRLLIALLQMAQADGLRDWFNRIAAIVGARKQPKEIERVLEAAQAADPAARVSVITGLGDGVRRARSSLHKTVPPRFKPMLTALADEAQSAALNDAVKLDRRVDAVGGVDHRIDVVGIDRMLFGSHAPLFYVEAAVLKLRESQLSQSQADAVRRNNARRLLAAGK
jgi:hypothetical protein